MASLVVPGRGSTITRSSPSSALTREDLPTFGRPPDLDDERFGGARNEPAGINQHELAPGPFAGRLETIAGHPGDVGDDRVAAGEEPVEERGLPDVGPADDGHGGHPDRRHAVA